MLSSKEINNLFIQHQKMIQKKAHQSARAWHLDYQDLEAQAYLLFCEAARTYDPLKGKFSTYLTTCLKDLDDSYCRREVQGWVMNVSAKKFIQMRTIDDADVWGHTDPSFDKFCEVLDMAEAAAALSADALDVLIYVLGFNECPWASRKPGRATAINWFRRRWGWAPSRVSHAWDEIKVWYNQYTTAACV